MISEAFKKTAKMIWRVQCYQASLRIYCASKHYAFHVQGRRSSRSLEFLLCIFSLRKADTSAKVFQKWLVTLGAHLLKIDPTYGVSSWAPNITKVGSIFSRWAPKITSHSFANLGHRVQYLSSKLKSNTQVYFFSFFCISSSRIVSRNFKKQGLL